LSSFDFDLPRHFIYNIHCSFIYSFFVIYLFYYDDLILLELVNY